VRNIIAGGDKSVVLDNEAKTTTTTTKPLSRMLNKTKYYLLDQIILHFLHTE